MLTLVLPFYMNNGMLARQYAGWAGWPTKRKRRLRVILVDDGSPEPAADVPRPAGLPALEIYRVSEDRPWHQNGARNLGAHVAPEGWLLLTDMDHVLTDDAARALFKRMDAGALDSGTAYMLDRIEADTGLPTLNDAGLPKPHPNSFLMTRETYWHVGGYDEEYRGYGTDSIFRARLFARAKRGHLDVPLARYWRDLIPDASTTTLGRKEAAFRCPKDEITRRKISEGRENEIRTLDFEWSRVL